MVTKQTSYPAVIKVLTAITCIFYIIITNSFIMGSLFFVLFLLNMKTSYVMIDEEYLYKKKTICPFWAENKYNKYPLGSINSFENGFKNIIVCFPNEKIIIDKTCISRKDKLFLLDFLNEKVIENSKPKIQVQVHDSDNNNTLKVQNTNLTEAEKFAKMKELIKNFDDLMNVPEIKEEAELLRKMYGELACQHYLEKKANEFGV